MFVKIILNQENNYSHLILLKRIFIKTVSDSLRLKIVKNY
jgi:hypothetical protein